MIRNNKGQSILEYAMLLGVVVAAIVAIQIQVGRSVKGRFIQSAGQIGEAFTTAETYTIETGSQSSRREQTIASLEDANTPSSELGSIWTKSTILATTVAAPSTATRVLNTYNGELNYTDYVAEHQVSSTLQKGTHDKFDSGKLDSDRKLFTDD